MYLEEGLRYVSPPWCAKTFITDMQFIRTLIMKVEIHQIMRMAQKIWLMCSMKNTALNMMLVKSFSQHGKTLKTEHDQKKQEIISTYEFTYIFKNGRRLEVNTKCSHQFSQGNDMTGNYYILLKCLLQVFQKGCLFLLKQKIAGNSVGTMVRIMCYHWHGPHLIPDQELKSSEAHGMAKIKKKKESNSHPFYVSQSTSSICGQLTHKLHNNTVLSALPIKKLQSNLILDPKNNSLDQFSFSPPLLQQR